MTESLAFILKETVIADLEMTADTCTMKSQRLQKSQKLSQKKTAKKPVEKKVSSLKKLAPAPKKDAAPKKLAGSNAELFPVLPEKEEFVPAPKKVFVPAPRKSAASSDEWTSICKKAPKAPKLTQE